MTLAAPAKTAEPLVLLVEDDQIMRLSLEDRLRFEGVNVACAETCSRARQLLDERYVDLVISDIRLPDGTGNELFELVSRRSPGLPMILMTAFGSIAEAVDLVKAGAVDYLTKPFRMDDFITLVRRTLCAHEGHLSAGPGELQTARFRAGAGALGASLAMRRIERLVSRVAPLDSSVLLTGESGVGKEVIADLIHHSSSRAGRPFVKVNCAAIPSTLVESELFGHEKGAFTGADRRRIGRFEQAQGGAIFLDEIAEMSPEVQVKLLRVLQERSLERIGSRESVLLNVRIIAATQVDLRTAIERGAFRADLFWRLNVIHMDIPPLRERREDIIFLAQQFVAAEAAALGRRLNGLSPDAEAYLLNHPFPGNVRELKNLIERAAALCDGSRIELHDLADLDDASAGVTRSATTLRDAVEEAEREVICNALHSCDWVIGRAAERLGISRKNLWEKMRRYGITNR